MEYSLGFNGYFQLETWTPLTIVLENRGRATSGTLEVIVTSGSEYLRNIYQTTYSMDVELPYNSTKLCSFTILITSFTHDLIIRLQHAEETLLSRSINLRPYHTTQNLAIVLDDKTSPDFLSALPQNLFSVNVRPRFLPETWYGYEGVKMVIIDAGMLKRLREQQFQALLQWIKRGGYLVTAGGVNYGALLEERVQRLLPIHIGGHQQVFELQSLQDFCGQRLASTDPFLILRTSVEDSYVLVQEDDIPIITQKTIGVGKIIFVAFDLQNPPFSRWANRRMFWDNMLSLQPVIETSRIDVDNRKILDALLSNMPKDFPDVKFTFIFLGIYVFFLRFLLKALEKHHARRWKNGGYLLIFISIFSIASYWFFLYPNDRKRLTYNSFSLINITRQQKLASGKYIIGLYTTKETVYNLGFGSVPYPVTFIVSTTSTQNIPGSYQLYAHDSGQRVKGLSEKWSYNFFMVQSTFEFPISGQARFDEQNLHLTIKNVTPHKLIDCQVYFKNRLFPLSDDILPDTEYTKNITRSEIEKQELFDAQQAEKTAKSSNTSISSSFLQRMQKSLAKDVFIAVHSQYPSEQETLYLIGWVHSGIIQADFTKSGIVGEDLTLITWEIPVDVT
jgi:hypothetical protein